MVYYGIDMAAKSRQYDKIFKGRRIGLITNHTGLDSGFRSTIDILNQQYRITALFAPEHGVRGDVAAGVTVENTVDPVTGIPVYSLYRKNSKRLTDEMLAEVDIIVFDIQDVGSRYYTYLYTMLYAMESCAAAGIPFVVLDRPNPLGGEKVEGNIVHKDYLSFVSGFPLCMRYGLTIGEFAMMANETLHPRADLTVIRCSGWKRSMQWPDTGLSWVMPSPNLPSFHSALLYSGTCLFEGTNLSEGRGTTLPFELIGAPFITQPVQLADEMNRKRLPGVLFRPVWFTPNVSKHKGLLCGGVQIHIMNRYDIRPVQTALTLLYEIRTKYESDFNWCTPLPPATRPHIELLGGDGKLTSNTPLDILLESYHRDEEAFLMKKQAYHLYD
jgi:uncharacterized protein YbbC (DUF1343 family)